MNYAPDPTPVSSAPDEPDVVIIGCGPAGAAAATVLSRLGHRVLVLTRAQPPTPRLAKSVPPSCRATLRAAGLLQAVDSAGFYPTTGNTAWWAGRERIEPFPAGSHGYQVEAEAFELALRAEVAGSGAELLAGATVLDVEVAPGGASIVRYRHEDRTREVRARWLLDGSGRAGVVAKRLDLRRAQPGPATLAVMAAWERAGGWDLPHPDHTLVESHEEGWTWSIPVSDTVRHFTVMLDPRVAPAHGVPALDAFYAEKLASAPRLHGIATCGRRVTEPSACSASPYTSAQFGGDGFLLLGDAASFIDPLSSFGVKKAVASGWLAAIVVNTAFHEPAGTGLALELFAAREERAYASFHRLAAAFADEAATAHGHPFWQARTSAPEPIPARQGLTAAPEPDVQALKHDPDVLAAFEWLRKAPSIRLQRGSRVRLVERPTVRGDRVVREARVAASGSEFEARHLRGVDLLALLDIAGAADQVPELYEAYCRAHEPVILPDFLGVLAVTLARGLLESAAPG